MIDTSIGVFMNRTEDATYEFLEQMAMNNYQWPSARILPKKAVKLQEMDVITALTA